MSLNLSACHDRVRWHFAGIVQLRRNLTFIIQTIIVLFLGHKIVYVVTLKIVDKVAPDFSLLVNVLNLHLRFDYKMLE